MFRIYCSVLRRLKLNTHHFPLKSSQRVLHRVFNFNIVCKHDEDLYKSNDPWRRLGLVKDTFDNSFQDLLLPARDPVVTGKVSTVTKRLYFVHPMCDHFRRLKHFMHINMRVSVRDSTSFNNVFLDTM